MWMLWYLMSLLWPLPSTTRPTTSPSAGEEMPPEPPLTTSTVAVDRNGNAWLYEPAGVAKPLDLMPLGSTNPGTTPPANPSLGWLWWDSGVNELKVWNGTSWIASAGGGSGGIGEPTTAGNWLRTNAGTWVAGLPLAPTAATTIALGANNLTFTGTGTVSIPTLQGYLPLAGGAVTGAVTMNITAAVTNLALNGAGGSALPTFTVVSGRAANVATIQATAANGVGLIVTQSAGLNPGSTLRAINQGGATTAASAIYVQRTATTAGTAVKLAGGNRIIRGSIGTATAADEAGTTPRWDLVLGDTAAEGGGNTGTNFQLSRYADAGTLLDAPLSINRATGAVTIPNLILPGLPTADPGVPGAVWNNGGVLNISP